MKFYRGNNEREWEDELDSIMKLAEEKDTPNKISFCGNLKVLRSPTFLRPFRCAGILFMLYSMSGIMIVSTYTDTFFEVCIHAHFSFSH